MNRLTVILALFLSSSMLLAGHVAMAAKYSDYLMSDDVEFTHAFFKGRRALAEGVEQRVSPMDDVSPDAAAVAKILEPCEVASEQKSDDVEVIKVNGSVCQINSSNTQTQKFSNTSFTQNQEISLQTLGADIIKMTGVNSAVFSGKQDFVLKDTGGGEFDVVSAVVDTKDSVQTTAGIKVNVVEKTTYNDAKKETLVKITLTAPGKSFYGTYSDLNGKITCTMNRKIADCGIMAYAYGYDKGPPLHLFR